ncbi:MAG: substrate-binding domain-containing protein [Geminicoccaceae bacterium]
MRFNFGVSLAALLVAAPLVAGPALAADDVVAAAKAAVAAAVKPNPPWDGPTTGPKIQAGKTIVYVSTDERNGGARGVGQAVTEAGGLAGWTVRTLDGQGSVSGRSAALNQAIALQPDGIVLGGIDAAEQAAAIDAARAANIPVVGWHATASAGPSADGKVFTNITTDPLEVAKAAASFAIADSDGKAGVVIFTDSVYAVAIAKSNAMAEVIKACPTCELLSVEDTPLSDVSSRMPTLTTALMQRFGDKWTYALGINDLYFDFMAPALASAGVAGDGYPKNVSAGDGSEVAFQRIRGKQYQVGTVAEPLRLQGWQIVDELNRALSGEKPSGYVPPTHLFTPDNIQFDGGPNNIYDPDNGYTDAYKKIWGIG